MKYAPQRVAYTPVCRQALAGPQTGWQVKDESNLTPSDARRVRFGVRVSFIVSALC